MLKKLIIPVAAIAVSATSVGAFSTDMLEKINIDLSSSQISALEEAHTLRESGADKEDVKTFLEEAGLDKETMKDIRDGLKEVHEAMRESVNLAIENNDFDAFSTAVANTPLGDAIVTESDFEKFAEAHALRESGDHEGAHEIIEELGIEKSDGHGPRGHKGEGGEKGPRGDKEVVAN